MLVRTEVRMKSVAVTTVWWLAALLVVPAYAGFQDGNSLVNSCGDNVYGCLMPYAAGLTDMHQALGGTDFCLPVEVTQGQVADVFKKYLDDNPAVRHHPAAVLFIEAMRAAFPC
jgi:hypothetical protein